MNRNTWKEFERRIARFFNTFRTPLSGSASRHTSGDIISDKLYVECKMRKKMWVASLYKEVKKSAQKEGKIPILAIKELNSKDDLLVIKKEDLKFLSDKGTQQRFKYF